MTETEYYICETQGKIFELAADDGYDIENFTNVYLKSDFCRRQFDTLYSRYQYADAEESWEIFLPEIKDRLHRYEDGQVFRGDVAWWFGFTYRQLWYESGVASSNLADRVPVHDLVKLYPAYHTLDEEMAAEKLIAHYGLGRRRRDPA